MAISFAWFLSLYYFLTNGSYPQDADEKVKQRVRYQCKKLVIAVDGRLLEENSGRELLHEANALEKVKEIHQENHLGILNTLDKVVKFYVLKDARDMVTTVVKTCETCQFRERVKAVRSNPGAIVKTPRHPFFMVSVDAVGPLSVTARNNRYILTGICHLTRYPVALAVPDIDENTTGEFYFSFCKFFGVPQYILSDRGANFISTYVHHFLKKLGCKNIMTTSYRPQANGMCERLNGSLCSVLAKLASDQGKIDQWDLYLDAALMVLRSTKNVGTGFSPSYLLFGYEFRTPAVWVAPRLDFAEGEEQQELAERIELIQDQLVKVREEARLVSDERKKMSKRRYDAKVVFRRPFEVGEEVLLKVAVQDSKFGDRWEGPYTVLSVNSKSGTYHLTGKNSLRLKHAVNGDRLKLFHREAKHMVPDVLVAQANEQFQRWVNSRVNAYSMVDTAVEF